MNITGKTIGGALGVMALASVAGMSARLATCKKDSTPEGAIAMLQGDTFSLAPCPIFLMKDDSVRGGFFRSTFLNKLGKIDKDGTDHYLGGLVRGDSDEEGKLRNYRGHYLGKTKDNGRVKNSIGDEVGTLYDLEGGNKTAGVTGAQKKALGLYVVG